MNDRALRAVLKTGRTVKLRMTGSSMRPLLREPMVLEVSGAGDPRIGDVVVFADRDTIVAHRLFARRRGVLLTAGDAQPECVESVPLDRVLGRVTRVYSGRDPDAQEIALQRIRAMHLFLALTRAPRALFRLAARAFPLTRPRRFAAFAAALRAVLMQDRAAFAAAWARDRLLIVDEARRRRLLPYFSRIQRDFGAAGSRSEYLAAGVLSAARVERRARMLLDLLAGAGIRAIPLKGAHRSLCEPAAAALHPSSDVDVLVRPEDRTRACEVLRSGGYRQLAPDNAYHAHHHAAPFAADDDVPVEVHDALAPASTAPRGLDWPMLEQHICQDGPYPHLDPLATLLHLLAHQLDPFVFRDAVLAAGLLARSPELLEQLPARSFRIRALAVYASRLAGLTQRASALESRYLRWIVRREDLPAYLRNRSQGIDALFALAAGDAFDARCALLSGIAGSPTCRGLVQACARIAGRILVAPAAALYAVLLPRFRPAQAQINPSVSN